MKDKIPCMSNMNGINNENNYLNNYLNNKIRTFQTNDKIYGDFKKTCVQLDINIGDKLTDLMKEFIIQHNSKVEILNSAGREEQLLLLPPLFESDEYWKQYFIFASYDTCKKIRNRLNTLLSITNIWASLSRQAESIDCSKELNKETETDKVQCTPEPKTCHDNLAEFY